MSTSENQEGDLIPLSANVIEWVYGNAEYVGSVFGTTNPTRRQLQEYYDNAKNTWSKVYIDRMSVFRDEIYAWIKASNINGLDFYFPYGSRHIWFKYMQDSFAFRLKFAIIDK